MNASKFRTELEHIVNCNSMESGSITPDFILADYLIACLAAYDTATQARTKWFAPAPSDLPIQLPKPEGEL